LGETELHAAGRTQTCLFFMTPSSYISCSASGLGDLPFTITFMNEDCEGDAHAAVDLLRIHTLCRTNSSLLGGVLKSN